MPISNTARLTVADVAAMNDGFRRIGYDGNGGLISNADIVGDGLGRADSNRGLANYYGVAASTVRSWLQPAGRNIVVKNDGSIPVRQPDGTYLLRRYYGATNRRIYCMTPPTITRADPRNSLRLRMFLAAAMGAGGLEAAPAGNSR